MPKPPSTAKTPGFSIRLRFRFSETTDLRTVAHYWSTNAMRWMPYPVDKAREFIRRGQADETTEEGPPEL